MRQGVGGTKQETPAKPVVDISNFDRGRRSKEVLAEVIRIPARHEFGEPRIRAESAGAKSTGRETSHVRQRARRKCTK